MNNINLNIPVSVFAVGFILFLFAPYEYFYAYSSQEISMTGLMIEFVGIAIGLLAFYRHKVTQTCMQEI